MTLAELLKALVECEDQMQRMELVESNQELLNPTETEEGGEEENTTGSTEDWEAKYNELKKKYIDTFFGGQATGEETEEETKSDEPDPSDNPTMEELLNGKKEGNE